MNVELNDDEVAVIVDALRHWQVENPVTPGGVSIDAVIGKLGGPTFDHPKSPSGRFLCSPEHPMPKDAPEGTRWEHVNLAEVDGTQRDGWPCGDTVLMRCADCGLEHRIELPQ